MQDVPDGAHPHEGPRAPDRHPLVCELRRTLDIMASAAPTCRAVMAFLPTLLVGVEQVYDFLTAATTQPDIVSNADLFNVLAVVISTFQKRAIS